MKTEIIIGNQAVRVKTSDPQLRIILQGLFDHLTYFELVANPQTKKYTRKPSMYFFVYKEKEDYVDFIISKNNFNDLLYQLKVSEINKELFKVYNRTYIDHKVDIKLHGNFIPRESQENYIRNIVETGITNTLLDLQTGFGKSVSVDTPVRIPDGWKNMGDIQVGDEVISQDGSITNVIGVYPQGELDMYKITFEDGRNVECCLEHLWYVYSKQYSKEGEVINTKTIMEKMKKETLYIDLVTSEQNNTKVFDLPIEHVVTILEESNIEDINYFQYLNGSTKQRQEFFNTFKWSIDTNNNRYHKTYKESLVLFLTELTRSLGGLCKVIKEDGYFIVKPYFKLSIFAPTRDKKIKHKLRINKIEPIGKKEAQCIAVEHPSKLFVVKDYIVTHNTLIGFFSAARLASRTAILVKPTFVNKWIADVKKYSPVEEEELFIIQGSDSLTKLFSMDKIKRDKIKLLIISIRTISIYFDSYYTDEFKYDITPYEFMDFVGITNILNDESHKEFEALFKTIMWMDPKRLIGMSATMESDDRSMNYFYNLLYPISKRLTNLFGIHKYATLLFYEFALNHGVFIPHKGYMGYNHVMYEQHLMRNQQLLKDYIAMLIDISITYYDNRKDKGDKLLIFFSTIDMCTLMHKAFSKHYTDLNVKRYVEKDSYDEMLSGDIIISTNGSVGIGIDIPNLITTIQTVPISSRQLNIQALGRLREIEGKEVIYISLFCENIVLHKKYKDKRLQVLKKRVVKIAYEKYDKKLGNIGAINVNTNKPGKYNNFSSTYKKRRFGKNNYSNYNRR